jgi:hypothetical protein
MFVIKERIYAHPVGLVVKFVRNFMTISVLWCDVKIKLNSWLGDVALCSRSWNPLSVFNGCLSEQSPGRVSDGSLQMRLSWVNGSQFPDACTRRPSEISRHECLSASNVAEMRKWWLLYRTSEPSVLRSFLRTLIFLTCANYFVRNNRH